MENLDVFMSFYDSVETLYEDYIMTKNVEIYPNTRDSSYIQTRLFIHVYTVKKKKVEPT